MSLKARLMGNGIATLATIGWIALIQLISVPLLAGIWGIDRYGQWVMLATIPTYFALSDLGFATAATSDMTMEYTRGKQQQVLIIFQSVWSLLLLISLMVLVLASPLLFVGPMLARASTIWWAHQLVALYWMIAFSMVALISRVVLAGFRSTGNFAAGTMLYDAIGFVEGCVVILVARAGGSFTSCAIVYFLIRLANLLICYWLLRRKVPWLKLGFGAARRDEIRRLLRPALGAMVIPTALAINIQGLILVAGAVISPAAAAILAPVRTISRLSIQLVNVISRASMPEFAAAMARNDFGAQRKLLKLIFFSILFVLLPGAVLFGIFGTEIVKLWSRGRVVPEHGFIIIMAVGMFLHGIWFNCTNLLLAVNRHGRFAKILVFVSLVSIVLATVLGAKFGLRGLAVSNVISELLAVCGINYGANALFNVFGNSAPRSVANKAC